MSCRDALLPGPFKGPLCEPRLCRGIVGRKQIQRFSAMTSDVTDKIFGEVLTTNYRASTFFRCKVVLRGTSNRTYRVCCFGKVAVQRSNASTRRATSW